MFRFTKTNDVKILLEGCFSVRINKSNHLVFHHDVAQHRPHSGGEKYQLVTVFPGNAKRPLAAADADVMKYIFLRSSWNRKKKKFAVYLRFAKSKQKQFETILLAKFYIFFALLVCGWSDMISKRNGGFFNVMHVINIHKISNDKSRE